MNIKVGNYLKTCQQCGIAFYTNNKYDLFCSNCKQIGLIKAVKESKKAFIKSCHQEVEETVITKIRQRRDKGRKKYGKTMDRKDLSTLDWLRHAQEEMLDAAMYLQKLINIEEGRK